MKDGLPPPVEMDREEGRRAFGADAAGYDGARPAYPETLYALLQERCGLREGTATVEIGPGTGLATRRLLELGARPLVAVEPDERLAAYLRANVKTATGDGRDALEVRAEDFESVELPETSFDLVVSATAFHWLDQAVALAKIGRLLRPGGWWAMWWTVFGDPGRPDPFHEATVKLVGSLSKSPSAGVSWRAPFALDETARREDLEAAGAFEEIRFERYDATLVLDPARVRALYATFSSVNLLPDADREALLDRLARIAADDFGGRVERKLITAVYTARRRASPSRS